ncbi:hypothetical protein [Arthrobacter sp. H14-L1]|uniref:hypothetical protein n=1 Tax=Arthrobacter sp. H14-L1 TaxID=2996697 RepID=UPI00226F5753|nr:hypothetical protein [Arthrobacter sp. H14-L1]MCY0905634.1 hypothetical protein [Arthrobacter sp. H14-L1]
MVLFAAARQGRKDDAELGNGVWRRAHDRFRRGLDRFHQMLEGIEDRDVHAGVVPTANALADLLPRVRALCTAAQTRAPSASMDIPASAGGYLNDVHRELTRAGNALATAAEAVALVRLNAGPIAAVERRASTVHRHVDEAERLLDR